MEAEACQVDAHAPVWEVAQELMRRRLGVALVIRDGRLVGIFTATDSLRLLAQLGRSARDHATPNSADIER
jgi:CBS domain-containing protein